MSVTGSLNKHGLREQVQGLAHAALDLLFPPRCVVCHRVGAILCTDCTAEFERVPLPVCTVCGEPINIHGLCGRCLAAPRAFASVRSGFLFTGGARAAIHALKYEKQRAVARPLAQAASQLIDLPDKLDSLIAVPLYEARKAQRGYNQAELLAFHLAECWGLPLLPSSSLYRTRDTASQVNLGYTERQANVGGAFTANPAWVSGRAIILVDDVCTTGATLHACASSLLDAGAVTVHAVTIARAI